MQARRNYKIIIAGRRSCAGSGACANVSVHKNDCLLTLRWANTKATRAADLLTRLQGLHGPAFLFSFFFIPSLLVDTNWKIGGRFLPVHSLGSSVRGRKSLQKTGASVLGLVTNRWRTVRCFLFLRSLHRDENPLPRRMEQFPSRATQLTNLAKVCYSGDYGTNQQYHQETRLYIESQPFSFVAPTWLHLSYGVHQTWHEILWVLFSCITDTMPTWLFS